jgi:hypothetical protein
LVADLRSEFEGEDPFLWWESVRDHTRPGLDLDVIRARDDFSAAVVERVDRLIAVEADPGGFISERVLTQGPRKASALAQGTQDVDARSLVADARALALGLLEEESDSCT